MFWPWSLRGNDVNAGTNALPVLAGFFASFLQARIGVATQSILAPLPIMLKA
jgi:hypothetical protein